MRFFRDCCIVPAIIVDVGVNFKTGTSATSSSPPTAPSVPSIINFFIVSAHLLERASLTIEKSSRSGIKRKITKKTTNSKRSCRRIYQRVQMPPPFRTHQDLKYCNLLTEKSSLWEALLENMQRAQVSQNEKICRHVFAHSVQHAIFAPALLGSQLNLCPGDLVLGSPRARVGVDPFQDL